MDCEKILIHEDILREHIEKFGGEPKVGDIDPWSRNQTEMLIEAIETGVPFDEPSVPRSVVT